MLGQKYCFVNIIKHQSTQRKCYLLYCTVVKALHWIRKFDKYCSSFSHSVEFSEKLKRVVEGVEIVQLTNPRSRKDCPSQVQRSTLSFVKDFSVTFTLLFTLVFEKQRLFFVNGSLSRLYATQAGSMDDGTEGDARHAKHRVAVQEDLCCTFAVFYSFSLALCNDTCARLVRLTHSISFQLWQKAPKRSSRSL